MYRITIK